MPTRGQIVEAPGRLPVVGHLAAFHRDRLGFVDACRGTGAAVVLLRLARPTYLLLDPEDIQHVLVREHRTYAKTARITGTGGRRAVGSGVLTVPEASHRVQRRTVQPLFRADALARFGDTVVRHADAVLDRWRDGEEVDVSEAMIEVAQRVMLEAVVGARTADERRRALRGIVERRRGLERSTRLPFAAPPFVPLALRPRRRRALRELEAVLDARRGAGASGVPSLVDDLAGASGPDGERLTPVAARDEALSLAVAGFEAIGRGMGWALLALAEHPEAADRQRAEVAGLAGAPPDAASVERLPFTAGALSEAMRLRPPGWIMGRDVTRDDTLPSGARLPAGSRVLVSQWATHRDPRLFPDPERYDPERFLEPASGRPKLAYFPFGAGPRECVGRRLATLEGILVLARVTQRARLEAPSRPVRPRPGMTLRPARSLAMRVRLEPCRTAAG